MKRFLLFVFLLCFSLQIFAQIETYSKVKINFSDSVDFTNFLKYGVDLEGAKLEKYKSVTGVFSEKDITRFKKTGLRIEMLIEDMSKYFIEQNKLVNRERSGAMTNETCNSLSIKTPVHFRLGSMGGYLTLDEIMSQLDSMRYLYPNLISIKTMISASYPTKEGRYLYYARISKSPNADGNKPKILYSALTHAREPMGMQQMIFYMWYLLENYETSPEVYYLINNLEMTFVPCVNPDGYRYNQTSNPSGGGMLRTNRNGVDLNRNYGYYWGKDDVGSSPTYGMENYRGTAAFSEPETKSMKALSESKGFIMNLDYHCYGNFLIYPNYLSSSDQILFSEYSELMNDVNGSIHGSENQTVGYSTNGSSNDWFYGEQSTKPKMYSWNPEIGNEYDNFWAPSSRIIDLSKSFILQNLKLAHFALKYAKIKDESPFLLKSNNGYLKYSIKQLGQLIPANYTFSINPISTEFTQLTSSKNYTFQTVSSKIIDSIPYSIDINTAPGTELKYELSLNNGLYKYSDTISKIYGIPDSTFTDLCSSLDHWTSVNWGISTSEYLSKNGSFYDYPSGYPVVGTSSITLKNPFDLTNATKAYLNYSAKWDIGKGYDYLQLQVSSDNGTTWTPLCGKYTSVGTSRQLINQPVYDGYQMDWNQEYISLENYLGKQIKLRFLAQTSSYCLRDGFYLDDFELNSYTSINTSARLSDSKEIFVYPNPISGSTSTIKNLPNTPVKITIFNYLGEKMVEYPSVQSQEFILNLEGYRNGVYIVNIDTPKNKITRRIIKME